METDEAWEVHDDERQRFDGDSLTAGGLSPLAAPSGTIERPLTPARDPGTESTEGGSIDAGGGGIEEGGGIIAGEEVAELAGEALGENSAAVASSLVGGFGGVSLKRACRERWSEGNWDAGRKPSERTASSEGRRSTCVAVTPEVQKM